MSDRPPNLRWAPRVAALFTMLLPLADCGPTRNQFAPPCPTQVILGDAADLDVRRGGSSDLTDLVLHGRIIGMQGTCHDADKKKNMLAVTVMLGVEVTRGPAMTGREADVPVFLAVTQGQTIIDKHNVLMHVVFPSNVDRVTLTPGEMNLLLPVTSTRTGAAYTLIGGFQRTTLR
jgi:hypothetical protein